MMLFLEMTCRGSGDVFEEDGAACGGVFLVCLTHLALQLAAGIGSAEVVA